MSREAHDPVLPLDPRPLVLVADDEVTPRSIVARMIRGLGYRVRPCRNGRDSLRFLREYPGEVRLLIADLGMPNMDGGELVERALDLDRTLRVLLLADPADSRSTELLAGYDDMPSLSKPVTFDQLADRMEELLGAPRPAAYPPSMGPPRVRSRRRSSGHHEM